MDSRVCLLSTRNHAFAKLIAQFIRLRENYPEHQIKSIRMDNAAEFSSKAFNDYCMPLGIQVQYSAAEFSSKAFNDYCMPLGIHVQHYVPYVHTQNGLAESLIK